LLVIALAFALCSLPFQSKAQCTQQVWFDDFNDLSKWNYETGNGCGSPAGCGFGNGELQTYTNSTANVSVANSKLTITAIYDAATNSYTSGKLVTRDKLDGYFSYGKIEASMKLSSAGGAWPAFWLLPKNNQWPTTGEIDIMEAMHKNPKVEMGTIHYNFGAHQYTGGQIATTDLSAAFHTYGIEWQKDKITWFFDGAPFFTATPASTVGGAWPFNDTSNPFYMILNLAVGGPGTPFTGNIPPTPADFPTTLQVDWVRVSTGTWNVAVTGSKNVYQSSVGNVYSVTPVPGATYNWTVPAGATIASGQGTSSISVNFGSAGGEVVANVSTNCGTNAYKQAVIVEAPFAVDKILEDFQTNRNITLKSTTGTFVNGTTNPSATAPNTSGTVGKYNRNASEQYDVLAYSNVDLGNANDFVTRKRRIQLDIYTAAPVGTKITLQLENATSALSTNYPTGRHSIYEAVVTKQNAWQTLEFTYVSSPDPNVGIFGVNQLVFLFNSNSNSGDTYYFDNLKTGRSGAVPAGNLASTILDYETNNALTYKSSSGVYGGKVDNPSAVAPNTSANVGKYTRSAADLYDVLFLTGPVGDAGLFKEEIDYFTLDVYTSAPAGTVIALQLENSALSLTGNYPTGRNSVYQAKTTKTNAWETVRFYYSSSPDGTLSNFSIDQVVLLFNPNSSTNHVYYFDNLKTFTTDPNRNVPFTQETVLEDYQTNQKITYTTSTGTYVNGQVSPGGSNTSTVGKYTRNATELYDVLNFNTTAITDAAPFKNRQKKFALDLYTTAPVGSVISFQLETGASVPTNYPTGRHSIYQAVTTKQNQWETITFNYASTPDGGAADNAITKIVMLFKPNSSTGDVYYIDNIRTLAQATSNSNVAPTVNLTSPAGGATFAEPATITIAANAADTDGSVSKVEFYNGGNLLGTATTSPYNFTWRGVAAGTYTITAKATDNGGTVTTSAAVSVRVNGTPPVTTNLAINKSATVSSAETAALPGSAAVDGNGTTRWSSGAGDPQWIYVDLGVSYDVNQVKVTWEAAYGKDYLVQLSPDATTWTTIKTVTGNTALVNDHTGLTGAGRYVRIYGTARGTDYGYSIYELEVYGTANNGSVNGTACTKTVANGDYQYEVTSSAGNVTWKFVPLAPIAGSSLCLLHVKVGTGGYVGYNMTASGSNFTFTQPQTNGTALSFYFTYRVGTTTAERNSSATPHNYTAGTTCAAARTALGMEEESALSFYPNPVEQELTLQSMHGLKGSRVSIVDGTGKEVFSGILSGNRVNVAALPAGLYTLTIITDTQRISKRFVKK
jgi:beta-glucanase (GH16 family)